MHRSGTSALAGSLEQRGLYLGSVSTSNSHNAKGNRESAELRRLNEDVLRASGGAWRAPPPEIRWRPRHYATARELLSRQAGRPVWGFKDPRTLLTMRGWLALVPDLDFVAVVRHPSRVARSLARRDGLEHDVAVALWTTYNTRLRALLREREFPVLCFDDAPSRLTQRIDEIAGALALHERAPEPFFAPALRDEAPVQATTPAAEALYRELRALAR
jgi:hypothetical protein